jgi:hypothetical protein
MLNTASNFARRNALALVALFVALGGTSYAAFGVPANSVGTTQVRDGAITSSKLTVGNKNYLRAGLGAPAAAILTRVALAGSTTVAKNTSPGQTLSMNNASWNETPNQSDIAYGVASVTVPSACTSASIDAYVGTELVASGKVTSGNGGQAQTIGLRPEGAIQVTTPGTQNVTVKAVNSCASGTMTVSTANLTIAGFA